MIITRTDANAYLKDRADSSSLGVMNCHTNVRD